MSQTEDEPRVEPPPGARPDTPGKATLFCPECGHADRYDGGWRRVESPRTTRYRCPECGVVVTRRPNERRGHDPYSYLRSAWEMGVRFWGGLSGYA